MDSSIHGSRAPRPVAGLPAVDAREIAKGWLLELLAQAPLEDAGALPVAELAAEGPALAGATLAALADDTALARLGRDGDLEPVAARVARLAGTGPSGPAGAVRAVEALRRATADAVHAAGRLDSLTAAELADRLAHVCSLLAAAGAADPTGAPPAPPIAPPRATNAADEAASVAHARPEPEPEPEPVVPPEPEPGDEVRAQRGTAEPEGDAGAWRASVERCLERHGEDGTSFALLAIEVDGLPRLLDAQESSEVTEGIDALERALAGELRPADQLTRESGGRYWVTAPDTGPTVARLLAERLADAARGAASHRGAPLTVSIGIALCPQDGAAAEALAAHADRAMFAARASGTPVL